MEVNFFVEFGVFFNGVDLIFFGVVQFFMFFDDYVVNVFIKVFDFDNGF